MDTKNVAVISVDIQNDYCDPKGKIAQFGLGVEKLQKAVVKAKSFVGKARANDLSLVHIQMTEDPDFIHEDLKQKRIKEFGGPENWALTEPGTFGYNLILNVLENEKVITKNHLSAFINPEFERYLKSEGKNHLLVMGGFTHACVKATVLDAIERGFEVTVLKDLVGSPDVLQEKHNLALEEMERKGANMCLAEELFSSHN